MLKFITNKTSAYILILICLLVVFLPDLTFAAADDEKVDGGFVSGLMWSLVNGVFGVFVWLSGMLLNEAISSYVVGFGDKFINSGLGFAVNNLWQTVRDLFNLTFIFGLVYIGFKMILDASDSNAKRMLIHIILAALLVNFSLFFTKFIVDFSNIAATQIASGFGKIPDPDNPDMMKYLVADKFVNELGISKVWGTDGSISNINEGTGNSFTYIFFTMIIFIITAFVFFVGAILLMIRFVVLNLYMILSPIMFLGWVFPNMASYSQEYWRGFLGRAFFAPAYLLMLYFAATVLTQFAALGQSGNGIGSIFLDAEIAEREFDNVIPYFFMMAIFLIAAVVVGQKMGADGANMAISVGKSVAGRSRRAIVRNGGALAGAVTFGLAARTGQFVGGGMANKASQNKTLNAWAAKNNRVAEATLKSLRKVADSSFDARRLGVLGLGDSLGEGYKGGQTSRIKEQAKSDAEFQKSLPQNITRDENNKLIPEAEAGINKILEKNEGLIALRADISAAKKMFESTATNLQAERLNLEAAKIDSSRTQEIPKIEAGIKDLEETEQKAKELQKAKEDEYGVVREKLKPSAEVDYRYANQIAFRNRREREGETWKKNPYILGGSAAATGVAAGAVAAALGVAAFPVVATAGVAAGVGAAVARYYGHQNSQVAAILAKTYGKNGAAMAKNDNLSKELKLLKDEMDKEGKSAGAPAAKPESAPAPAPQAPPNSQA